MGIFGDKPENKEKHNDVQPESPPTYLDSIEKLDITHYEIDRKQPATLSVTALVSLKNGLTAPGIEVGFFVNDFLLGTAVSNEWGQVKFSAPWTQEGSYQLHAQVKGRLFRASVQLNYVSPVQEFGRYTVYDNGTVLDKKTGLMWMRYHLQEMDWHTACQQKGNGFAGYTDWRIPTIEELITLVDMEQPSRFKINPEVFPEYGGYWWSGTAVWGFFKVTHAKAVAFVDDCGKQDMEVTWEAYVRLVRREK